MNKIPKDKIALFVTALILTVSLFWGASHAWKQYEFRKWVCQITKGSYCYNTLPVSEEYMRRRELEKKKVEGNDFSKILPTNMPH